MTASEPALIGALGVHYSDRRAGRVGLGLCWAMVCWAITHYLAQRGLLRNRAQRPLPAERVAPTP